MYIVYSCPTSAASLENPDMDSDYTTSSTVIFLFLIGKGERTQKVYVKSNRPDRFYKSGSGTKHYLFPFLATYGVIRLCLNVGKAGKCLLHGPQNREHILVNS